jgi:post-segregation antitoxin (ccd killing protein)
MGLAVTVNSPNEKAPPTTEAFRIDSATGAVTVSAAVDPSHVYDINVSAATADGLASEAVRSDLSPISPPGG